MLPEHIKSIRLLLRNFPDEQSCLNYLEERRWNGKVTSPFINSGIAYKCKNGKYICKNTRKYFTVRTNSVFEKTKIPLQDWFIAIWLMSSHKKGISSVLLAKEIGVTQSTAWYLAGKIRRLLGMETEENVSGIFELDEACFGGLQGNRHKDNKIPNSQGGNGVDKTWVLGILQRNGYLRAYIMSSRIGDIAQPIIRKLIASGSVVISDAWTGYSGLNDDYFHYVVKDGNKITQNYNPEIHTNGIEGSWAVMKRGYNGIYNWWSKKHIQYYLDEFVFRRNHRNLNTIQIFSVILGKVFQRITYKEIKDTILWN